MSAEEESQPWEQIVELAKRGVSDELDALLEELGPAEAAHAMAHLSPEDQDQVLTTLLPVDAADLIEDLPEVQARELVDHLSPQQAAVILAEMRSDEQADLICDLPKEDAEAILAAMAPEEAAEVRALARFDPDTAGGLMITEYLSFPADMVADDVITELRRSADSYRDYEIQYLYVTRNGNELAGVVRPRDVLLAQRTAPLSRIMTGPVLSVRVDATLDELHEFFERHAFLGVPVVDRRGRLCGVLQRRAVDEALARRSDQDHLKSQGIVGGDELRTMPILLRSRRRLSWLSVNIVLNIIAASVIAMYQETLQAVIALAVFLPIISDMSGCSGNQAVAVSMREMAMGVLKPAEVLRVWLQELSVGFINGVVLGVLIAVAGWVWKGNPYLGLVAGGALAVNTLVAVSIGGCVPLLLKRFRMDPALASGPILTTVTDLCGFFFVLSFASAMLPHLRAA
jgi:magnesium transporter